MTKTNEEYIEIAGIIIDQMGGINRLKAMIGINKISGLKPGVQFKFKGSRKANKVVIDLDEGEDVYNMTFIKVGRLNHETLEISVKETGKYEGVYCDQLIEIFEDHTGLDLNLGVA